MDWHSVLDHLKGLLDGKGITFVVVLAARPVRRREVHAHVESGRVEFTAGDPESGRELVAALEERQVTVDWSGDPGDRITVR